MSDALMVSEIFGPTIQGEGPAIGTPAIFLRLMGCNLACRWCDTAYTWDASRYDLAAERERLSVAEVAARIEQLGPHLLVISGGEPMLQQARLQTLVERMPGRLIHVETAGTVAPVLRGVSYVVSLKLFHSGNPGELRYRPEVIDRFMRDAPVLAWKFVVADPRDLAEVDEIVQRHHLAPVYLMPEGTDSAVLASRMKWLVPLAAERGYAVTPRLHIDIWGAARGH